MDFVLFVTNLEPGDFAQVTEEDEPSTTAHERRLATNVSELNYTKEEKK